MQDAYFPATTYSRRFVPVLIFMGKLAQASSSCCQAVLEAGFLDLLLVLCLQDFSLPEAQPTGIIKDDPAYRENLLAIWDSVVEVFITDSIASPIYMAHPISMLWPYTLPGDQHLSQRQAAWRIMQYDSGYVALRLEAIRRALYHLNGVLQDRMAAVNICIDIFELARYVTVLLAGSRPDCVCSAPIRLTPLMKFWINFHVGWSRTPGRC